jgi:hypothetical protein
MTLDAQPGQAQFGIVVFLYAAHSAGCGVTRMTISLTILGVPLCLCRGSGSVPYIIPLAGIMPYLADIAQQNANWSGAAGLAATTLGGAVDDYLKLVARTFLQCEFTKRDEILRALADDHMRKIVWSPERLPKAARALWRWDIQLGKPQTRNIIGDAPGKRK